MDQDVDDMITLEIHICDQRRSYLAHFSTEDQALDFLKARGATRASSELPDRPFDYQRFPRLYDYLYPTCEHGLSASLCAGPGHYPPDNPYA